MHAKAKQRNRNSIVTCQPISPECSVFVFPFVMEMHTVMTKNSDIMCPPGFSTKVLQCEYCWPCLCHSCQSSKLEFLSKALEAYSLFWGKKKNHNSNLLIP